MNKKSAKGKQKKKKNKLELKVKNEELIVLKKRLSLAP